MNADRLRCNPAAPACLDLPRSPGALAAAPLSDRPLHQPRAAQTPTPCAGPALPPDTSLKSSPPVPAPTAADRPNFRNSPAIVFGTHTSNLILRQPFFKTLPDE